MANQEHVKLLEEGVESWNAWRSENQDVRPDFTEALLEGMDLRGAKLRHANFERADLSGSNFGAAAPPISGFWSNATDEDMLPGEFWADALEIALGKTDLRNTTFKHSTLRGTSLRGSVLTYATLQRADVSDADLTSTIFGSTHFYGLRISRAEISDPTFRGPCPIDRATLIDLARNVLSISDRIEDGTAFLRGCGLSDWEIEATKFHNPELSDEAIGDLLYKIHDLRTHQALQISPLFISYSHSDHRFVDKLENSLDHAGIRFWRDIHHAKAGRLETQIDYAIRHNPTVLLVLSENSVRSDWVQHEVRAARKLELADGRDVLCPIALDDSWKTCNWPTRVMEQVMEYNILDFSGWEEPKIFDQMFGRLVSGLGTFY